MQNDDDDEEEETFLLRAQLLQSLANKKKERLEVGQKLQ